MGDYFFLNFAHQKTSKHKSIVVESKAYTLPSSVRTTLQPRKPARFDCCARSSSLQMLPLGYGQECIEIIACTKRMELFHYEFQHEQQQYRQQKKKEDDEKLDAIMKYTLTTFKRLNFGETEIFQICECVRYFVTNRICNTLTILI